MSLTAFRRFIIALLVAVLLSATPVSWAASYSACIQQAARQFDLPVLLLTAIRQQEGGTPGSMHANANGTVDFGVMQINSAWLPELIPAGYTPDILRWDACHNIMAGAWILALAMHREHVWRHLHPDSLPFWRAVGAYHSRTPSLNHAYAVQIWERYQSLLHNADAIDLDNSVAAGS